MVLPLVALAIAQLFDLGTFIVMVGRHGPTAEANPLVSTLYVLHGLPLVALLKATLVLLVAAVVVLLSGGSRSRRHPRLAWTVVAAAVLAGMVGGLSNALTI